MAEYSAGDSCRWRNRGGRAKTAFALVVRHAGRAGAGSCGLPAWKPASFGRQRGGMRPLDRLSEYFGAVERRLRLLAITRGIAATAAAALIFTLVAVLLANYFAFSHGGVLSARFLLFFGIAF